MATQQEHRLPTLLSLFDSFWFEQEILTSKNPTPIAEIPNKLSTTPTFISRSFSDQCLSSKDSFDSDLPSPKSVLLDSKLQPILSGKEYIGVPEQGPAKGSSSSSDVSLKNKESYRKRRRNKDSKSLSELEFEEVKGFMDLGFVFSDKDSTLVSIIPGLQRLGKEGEEAESGTAVSRPYLSEAWDAMEEKRKNQNPLMNWRVPAYGNEIEMKNHLRSWAHTVASNVR